MPHRLTTVRRYKVSNDILVVILSHLDPPSLLRACQAFERIYALVKEYSPLYYVFELARAGMKDGPAPHSYRAPVGRLQVLTDYKHDWGKLAWTHEYALRISSRAHTGISAGFLHQIHLQGAQAIINFSELPSMRTGRAPSHTRHMNFNAPEIENVAIDRAQSLAVTSHLLRVQNGIGVVLHFRDLWTFAKHSRASSGVYDFNAGNTPVANMTMTVCGNKLAVSFEFSGGKTRHLILDWRTFRAMWLEENDVHFLNENYLLVVRRGRCAPIMGLYNITEVCKVAVEREYELPEEWNHCMIGFTPNTSPLSDRSLSSDAIFYHDPSTRVLVLTVKSPNDPSSQQWLAINESYFRPTSRKDQIRVPWCHWNQHCIIRNVHPSVRGPHVVGNRVVFLEDGKENVSRLNTIEFAPFAEARSCRTGHSWSWVGSRSVLIPNETSRSIPPKTVDGRRVEDIRVTEDNIVLFMEKQEDSRPIAILTFGTPAQHARSRPGHAAHSSQF